MDPAASVQYRLFGGANRIHWRAEDIRAIAKRLKVDPEKLPTGPMPAKAAPLPRIATRGTEAGRSYSFTISTGAVDRMGDTINPNGWQLGNYAKNPVVLFGHDATALPVGRATRTWVEGGRKLKATATFGVDIDPAAAKVQAMLDAGQLNATSVGFAPLRWEFVESIDRPLGINFIEQELLEFSIVPIPANPECLMDAATVPPRMAAARAVLAQARANVDAWRR